MCASILEKVLFWAQERKTLTAVADSDKSMTYAELGHAVVNAAMRLKKQGLNTEECVLIQALNCVDFVVGLLAVHYAGGIAVPLDSKLPEENLRGIQAETSARFLIANEAFFDRCQVIQFSELSETVDESAICELHLPESEQLSDLLFTTGTTGKPKGVLFNHRNLIGVVENLISGSHMDDGTVYLVYGPLNHAFSIRKVYYTLYCGCTLILLNGLIDIKAFYNMLDVWNVTATHLLPSAAKIILKLTEKRLAKYSNQLVMVESGTAPFPEEDMEKLRRVLPNTRLYFGYGCSESDSMAKIEYSKYPGRASCVGVPTVHSHIKLVDEQKNEVAATKENPGFIACKSIVNMVGYWNDPVLTAKVMQDGILYTNDLGYFDEDGFLYVLGRKGDVINVGGIKVSAKEIEELVRKYPAVEDCAVIPVEDPVSTQVPKLFVQIKAGSEYNERGLREFLRESMETYKLPKYIEVIDCIPKTYNGKVQKNRLG